MRTRACPLPGLLLSAASDFGDEWRDPVLIRLAESAIRAKRRGYCGYPIARWHGRVDRQQHGVYSTAKRSSGLPSCCAAMKRSRRLELPGPTYPCCGCCLASGGYKEAANEMLHQARVLYPGEAQADYVSMVQRICSPKHRFPIQQMQNALKALNEAGVKSLPLLMAYVGILEAHSWSSALDRIAQQATAMLL